VLWAQLLESAAKTVLDGGAVTKVKAGLPYPIGDTYIAESPPLPPVQEGEKMNPLLTFGIGELASSLYDKSGAKGWVDQNIVEPALNYIVPPAQAEEVVDNVPVAEGFAPAEATSPDMPPVQTPVEDSGILTLDSVISQPTEVQAVEQRSMFAEQADKFRSQLEEGNTGEAMKTASSVATQKINADPTMTDAEKAEAKKEFEAFGGSPDTWLLDFGLAMMSCNSPYFLQCVGAAGQAAQTSAKERELVKIKKADLKSKKEIEEIKLKIEQAKLAKELAGGKAGTDVWAKINPKDYTPESVSQFNKTGDYSVLRTVSGGETSPIGKIDVDQFTPASVQAFSKSGDYATLVPKASGDESSPLAKIDMAKLDPRGQKNVANFISMGPQSGFANVYEAAAGNFVAEEGVKPTETTKLIRERQAACSANPGSYECARLTSKVNTATAGVQTIDNPREAAVKLESNRRDDVKNLGQTSRTARQLMDLLGTDYETFSKGDWEATQRTLDGLIQTATHSYRSVTDWATLGDDLIDELQSIGTKLASGKPDENTWRNYRKLVDKTYNFVNNEINNINRQYDQVAESQNLSEFWKPSTGYATISDFEGFKGMVQQDIQSGTTPDKIREELRKRNVSPRDIERVFTELGIEG
jgi:hypothetical protein